jgi:hypothetical protein
MIRMQKIIIFVSLLTLFVTGCDSAADISLSYDHVVPSCTNLTLSSGGQTVVVPDSIVPRYFWGFMPQKNLDTVVLPTLSVARGATLTVSVVLSDNTQLKSVEMAYAPWLFSSYINFANPEGDIPLTPKSYTYTVNIQVPADAENVPWLENFFLKDGASYRVVNVYHKMELTVFDVNQNRRTIPIFVKVKP